MKKLMYIYDRAIEAVEKLDFYKEFKNSDEHPPFKIMYDIELPHVLIQCAWDSSLNEYHFHTGRVTWTFDSDSESEEDKDSEEYESDEDLTEPQDESEYAWFWEQVNVIPSVMSYAHYTDQQIKFK